MPSVIADPETLAWFCGLTSPLAGKKVVRALQDRGFDAYQPCETRWRRADGRRTTVQVPIFGPYLFIGCPAHRSIFDARSEGVHAFVCKGGHPVELPYQWIGDLRAEETKGVFDRTVSRTISLKAGQPVRIIGGPFKGLTAKIVEAKPGEKKIRVLMDAIGKLGGGKGIVDVVLLEAA